METLTALTNGPKQAHPEPPGPDYSETMDEKELANTLLTTLAIQIKGVENWGLIRPGDIAQQLGGSLVEIEGTGEKALAVGLSITRETARNVAFTIRTLQTTNPNMRIKKMGQVYRSHVHLL